MRGVHCPRDVAGHWECATSAAQWDGEDATAARCDREAATAARCEGEAATAARCDREAATAVARSRYRVVLPFMYGHHACTRRRVRRPVRRGSHLDACRNARIRRRGRRQRQRACIEARGRRVSQFGSVQIAAAMYGPRQRSTAVELEAQLAAVKEIAHIRVPRTERPLLDVEVQELVVVVGCLQGHARGR